MTNPRIFIPFLLFLLFAGIYSAQVLPRLSADSLTNDEPVEITNGYYYLTQGDAITPHLHPPLASALNAFPLLFLHLKTGTYQGDQLDRAQAFLFQWNRDQIPGITFWSRSVSWVFGLLIGGLLFWITREQWILCTATLFFWALDPTFGALAGISKIEMIPDFFFLLALWCFARGLTLDRKRFFFLAGMAAAAAMSAKYDTWALIPLFALLYFLSRSRPRNWPWVLSGWILGFLFAYLPFFVLSRQGSHFFTLLAEKFLEDMVFARHPFPVYLLGRAGLESHWYYWPVAFVVKEPVTFLLFLTTAWSLLILRKIQPPLWQWLPVVLLGLALLPVTNLGVRYLLPLYPFLFLLAGQAAAWAVERSRQRPLVGVMVVLLALWQLASLAVNFPHSVSYFNEFISPDKKIHWLADSNLDWGQDTKRLALVAQERHWGVVRLAENSGVDPKVYGLDWQPWQAQDLKGPQPGQVYVVNAGFFQLAPLASPTTRSIVESWLMTRPPTGQVGDCWYFYEIPGKTLVRNKGNWLPSVPFLQYRGYAFPLKRPS